MAAISAGTAAKTPKGFVPYSQFQVPTDKATNLPYAGRHVIASKGDTLNKYDHVKVSVLFAGLMVGKTKAKIVALTQAQIDADSATKNVTRHEDMEIMDVVVSANGKYDIDCASTATLLADGTFDIVITNFADEITLGQDLQIYIDWGYPNA